MFSGATAGETNPSTSTRRVRDTKSGASNPPLNSRPGWAAGETKSPGPPTHRVCDTESVASTLPKRVVEFRSTQYLLIGPVSLALSGEGGQKTLFGVYLPIRDALLGDSASSRSSPANAYSTFRMPQPTKRPWTMSP